MTLFSDLLVEHLGSAYARQLAFSDYLNGRPWELDIASGQVKFGSDLQFPVQLLGTEAEADRSWLWAWANEESDLKPSLIELAMDLRDFGVSHEIGEFTTGSFPLDYANGHTLALLASGMNAGCVYFRGPYEGGALFFLVQNVPRSIFDQVDATRIVTVLTDVIAQFPVMHLPMADCFLHAQGFQITHEASQLVATRDADGGGLDSLQLTFDDRRHIVNIDGSLSQAN